MDLQRDERLAAELRQKLYEGLKAQFVGVGIPQVGGAFEQAVLARAEQELTSLKSADAATLTLSSERLVTAVSASFNTVLSRLSGAQQMALRAGLDPFSPAVMQAANSVGGLSRLLDGRMPERAEPAAEVRSGRRYGELRSDDARDGSRSSYADLGLDSGSVALFKSTGLSRSVFDDLAQRYSLQQIKGAAGFAGELGVRADAFAGKFIDLDSESRDDLHEFVDQVRSDPSLSTDEKRQQIAAFRQTHPKLRKLTDNDLLSIVNARQASMRHEIGDEARAVQGAELRDREARHGASALTAQIKTEIGKKAATSGIRALTAEADDAFGVTATPPPKAKNRQVAAATSKVAHPSA